MESLVDHSSTDQDLLRAYAQDASESAFAELVRRHVDLVYSAARRMVRDEHLAEDVTQRRFIALAENARPLLDRPVISGWLHWTTQNLAANEVRSEVRRRKREAKAHDMNDAVASENDESWALIEGQLDGAPGN